MRDGRPRFLADTAPVPRARDRLEKPSRCPFTRYARVTIRRQGGPRRCPPCARRDGLPRLSPPFSTVCDGAGTAGTAVATHLPSFVTAPLVAHCLRLVIWDCAARNIPILTSWDNQGRWVPLVWSGGLADLGDATAQ